MIIDVMPADFDGKTAVVFCESVIDEYAETRETRGPEVFTITLSQQQTADLARDLLKRLRSQ